MPDKILARLLELETNHAQLQYSRLKYILCLSFRVLQKTLIINNGKFNNQILNKMFICKSAQERTVIILMVQTIISKLFSDLYLFIYLF